MTKETISFFVYQSIKKIPTSTQHQPYFVAAKSQAKAAAMTRHGRRGGRGCEAFCVAMIACGYLRSRPLQRPWSLCSFSKSFFCRFDNPCSILSPCLIFEMCVSHCVLQYFCCINSCFQCVERLFCKTSFKKNAIFGLLYMYP